METSAFIVASEPIQMSTFLPQAMAILGFFSLLAANAIALQEPLIP